jgi:hypothetical protein
MGTGLAIYTPEGQTDAARVDAGLTWLLRLPQLPKEQWPEMQSVETAVAVLSEPCNPAWCMARVAALLNPYYDKETPPMVRQMEAQDWLEALASYPQWAIERAVRWWKSADNPDRRKKPLEGDIAARCKVEMRGIGAVPKLLNIKAQGRYIEPDKPREKLSAQDRQAISARVLAQANFTPKTFGKETPDA